MRSLKTVTMIAAGIVGYALMFAAVTNVPACSTDQKQKVTDGIADVFDFIDKVTEIFMELNGKGELSDAGLVAADKQLRREYPGAFGGAAASTDPERQAWDAAVTAAKARIAKH